MTTTTNRMLSRLEKRMGGTMPTIRAELDKMPRQMVLDMEAYLNKLCAGKQPSMATPLSPEGEAEIALQLRTWRLAEADKYADYQPSAVKPGPVNSM